MPTDRTLVTLIDGRLELRAGRLAPRITNQAPDSASITLLATTALLLGGDHVAVHIRVGPSQHLLLQDAAATVAYNGRGLRATLDTNIELAANATLVWDAEPLILSSGAAVHRRLTACTATGARLLLRDQLVLGRTREPGGTLTCRTRMTHNGTPALAEDLMLAPEQLGIGVLGTARILDTAVALGWRPPTPDQGTLFALHAPGSLVRDLVTEAHLSSIPAAWASWRDAIATPDAVKSRP